MKAVAVLLVIVALTSAENSSEDDRINLAYAKHLKNSKLIGLKAGEETTLVQQEQFALTNKPAVPAWVSSEDDLEAFLQEEAMAGKKIVRRVTGVTQAGSVPEATMVQESAETPFDAATSKVSTMLEVDTMARRSACVKAADASINNVFTDVKNAQRMLNRLNNGRHCATRNQHLINRAKRTISLRNRQVRTALNYLRRQRRSRVRWNFSFESLREGSCSAFYRSGQWRSAKRRVQHANRRLVQRRAALRAARNNLKVQIRNARRARNACRCAVQRRTARELKNAKRLTGDRMKTLLREMMVKCLVVARKHGKNANKFAARCKSLRVSAAYKRRLRLFRTRLAPGVAATSCARAKLMCQTRTSRSNNAGIIKAHSTRGYTMLGGGMVNHYRSWNRLGAFEEAMPEGNHFRCDTGFGPGRLTCYNRACKTNFGALSCTTRSLRFRGSGVRDVRLPRGYTMTGGGLYNHYRHFNKHSGFEETRPNGNAWRGDMGFGWGDYTVYVRGCKAPRGRRLICTTRQSGRGNYNRVSCPSGYQVTSCGVNNLYRHFNAKSAYESHFPVGNNQCHCDTAFGHGDNLCYARCCKMA